MNALDSPWMTPRHAPALRSNEVHIWRVDLDRIQALRPTLERTLAPEECRRARQFSYESAGHRYILSCAVRRDILAGYLNAHPSELEFRYGIHGKPELASGAIHFSVAHSNRLAVCAVSRSVQVGVDAEHIRAGVEPEISGWFFSLRAIRFLETLPPRRRQRTFFQGWARMEAYAKALGVGLTIDLENLEALLTEAGPEFRGAGITKAEREMCWLRDFQPRQGYAGALAVRGGECKLKYWKWTAGLRRSGSRVGNSDG